MNCLKCDSIISEQDKFCHNCGTKIESQKNTKAESVVKEVKEKNHKWAGKLIMWIQTGLQSQATVRFYVKTAIKTLEVMEDHNKTVLTTETDFIEKKSF